MGAVYFYHLTRRPLEATLPVLLSRSLSQGWRVVVRGTESACLAWLDEKLWLGSEDEFLPHGLSGGAHDARQPILLTTDPGSAADCLMCVDGAEVTAAEVEASQRACILFDGTDPVSVERARTQWRSLTGAGCSAQYWSEESGTWEKKAEA
jgi:DNA polymerase-3 subunit chi